jgi:hypothetical protein
MCPFTSSDGHNFPRLVEEAVPGVAAMVEDIGLQGTKITKFTPDK